MISPELLRRYPFFGGLSHDNLVTLANAAEERSFDADHSFFKEDEELRHFYLVIQGEVAIVMDLPDPEVEHRIAQQYLGTIQTTPRIVGTVGPGQVFGWSGLVPPPHTTAGARSVTSCQVVEFDSPKLLEAFEADRELGYIMTQKVARVVRRRLHDMRVESLAFAES